MNVPAVLVLVISSILACGGHPPEAIRPSPGQPDTSERTQATLDRLTSLVQQRRWSQAAEFLRTANPTLDAERAFTEERAKYYAGGNLYFSLPSVPHADELYEQFEAWQPFPGVSDYSESAEHLAYQEVAEDYIAKFNARLVELKPK